MAETLRCPRCGGQNPTDARFCIDCGEALDATTGPTVRLHGPVCPGCQTTNPANARFCVVCGRSLTGDPPDQPLRPLPPQPTPPVRPAPQQSYPRVDVRQVPVRVSGPHTPPVAHPRRCTHATVPLVWIVGMFVLLITGSLWPGILLLIGISILVGHANAGHPERALQSLLWLGGLTVLFATGAFWPGVLVLIFLSWLLDRAYGPRRWPHW